MKKTLNKSYKRWSSRPAKYDPLRITALKKLFCIELANMLEQDSILINVDQVNFSNSTKSNYSWLDRGISWSRNNIWLQGSISFIWVISSLGNWFVSNLTENNNSQTFIEYLQRLYDWITNDNGVAIQRVILILDNCPIHKSRKTLDILNSIGWRVIFLAPYAPEWAPIELMFSTLKSRLNRNCRNQAVNLSRDEGIKNIREWFSTFSVN